MCTVLRIVTDTGAVLKTVKRKRVAVSVKEKLAIVDH